MDTTNPFRQGVNVIHPDYGPGVVTREGREYIGVDFERHGQSLLKLESSGLRLAHIEGKTDIPSFQASADTVAPKSPSWPDSTFIFELSQQDPHSMGSHWSPFYEDVQSLVERIPEVVQQAQQRTGYAEAFPSFRKMPPNWAIGWTLVWPHPAQGVALVIRQGSDANELVSMFPLLDRGAPLTLTLDKVIVWESGVEAQIEAGIGPASVSFYDGDFPLNRLHYEAGRPYEFKLLGIAYEAGIQQQREFTFKQNQEVLDWLNQKAEAQGSEAYEREMTLNLGNMAMLLPINEADRDDYHFSGPIKQVEEVEDVLGQSGWLVDVTVIRDMELDDEDIDLRILVTRRVWREDYVPEVGMTITGALWLQGRLWSTSPATGLDPGEVNDS